MARRNRRRADEVPALRAVPSGERRELWRGEQYVVRSVTGSGASKIYRCPGCDQQIRPGMPHLVIWPVDDRDAADRRHWHVPCWAARERRGPAHSAAARHLATELSVGPGAREADPTGGARR